MLLANIARCGTCRDHLYYHRLPTQSIQTHGLFVGLVDKPVAAVVRPLLSASSARFLLHLHQTHVQPVQLLEYSLLHIYSPIPVNLYSSTYHVVLGTSTRCGLVRRCRRDTGGRNGVRPKGNFGNSKLYFWFTSGDRRHMG